jgi:rSAM/selenodomain-associated transferase 2
VKKFSIIIPILNEEANIATVLASLQSLRQQDHEVIIVDGGSSDDTVDIARDGADIIIRSDRGRARQMNAGANLASGDVLLFLHADTRLPENAVELIRQALINKRWGRFDVRLSGTHPLFRLIEFMMNWRSRISGIATGDQAMFIEKKLFAETGGFAETPLMEDIALSKILKHYSRPACIGVPVLTSSRRWEEYGILKTIVLMWRLRLAYFFGVSPEQLVRRYH